MTPSIETTSFTETDQTKPYMNEDLSNGMFDFISALK